MQNFIFQSELEGDEYSYELLFSSSILFDSIHKLLVKCKSCQNELRNRGVADDMYYDDTKFDKDNAFIYLMLNFLVLHQ